jgi:ELWxxDGT repeat protein
VSGLLGTGLELALGLDRLPVTQDGTFTFPTPLLAGASYEVTVAASPVGPHQTCVVQDGQGTVASQDVENVNVTCVTNQYGVGGSVTGLHGSILLRGPAGHLLSVDGPGRFTFPGTLLDGTPFAVHLVSQPAHLSCALHGAVGDVDGADVDVQVSCGRTQYFLGTNHAGDALWKTDGTEPGTVAVKTFSEEFTLAFARYSGEGLFFVRRTRQQSAELWFSNGTAQGTIPVLDADTGPLASFCGGGVVLDGKLVFSGQEPDGECEPWTSDGTRAGTTRLADIRLQGGSDPQEFTLAGTTVFFTAFDEIHGRELWKTDGMVDGTTMVADLREGAENSQPYYLVAHHEDAYFWAGSAAGLALWRTDGTAAGTRVLLTTGQSGGRILATPAAVFFFHDDGTHGAELWKTDGTPEGTVLVKDVNPNGDCTWAGRAVASGDKVYFHAYEPATGTEVWASDGTEAGTQLLADFSPGDFGTSVQFLSPFPGGIVWSAYGRILVSDGTPAGTSVIHDFRTPVTDGYLSPMLELPVFALLADGVVFAADDGVHGTELWRTDGTAAGTVMVKDVNPAGSSAPLYLCGDGDSGLFFTAEDGVHGHELWRSDGTAAGTQMIRDINPGRPSSYPGRDANPNQCSGRLGSKWLLSADDGTHGSEPWVTDGTEQGTHLLADLNPSEGSDPAFYVPAAGRVFFWAREPEFGLEVWSTDGTLATRATDINPGPASSLDGGGLWLVPFRDWLFLVAQTPATGHEVFSYNTVNGTTQILVDSYPGYYTSSVRGLTAVGDQLFFTAQVVGGTALYVSGGTPGTTTALGNTYPGIGGVALGDRYVLATHDGVLYASDGTVPGTVLVKDGFTWPYEGPGMVSTNDRIFFCALHNDATDLWVTDLTPAGTVLLLHNEVNPDGNYPNPCSHMVALGDRVVFPTMDRVHGVELWVSDGSIAGTYLLKDIWPGAPSSHPRSFAVSGAAVYFAANDGVHGEELWASDGTMEGTAMVADLRATGDYGVLTFASD